MKEVEGKPKVNYVTVFERPGLREFLKQLSEFADLVLFTAGLEGLQLIITLCFYLEDHATLSILEIFTSCRLCQATC